VLAGLALAFVASASAWTIQSSYVPTTATYMRGIACSSSTLCLTAGFSDDESQNQLVSDTLEGGTWGVDFPPAPSGTTFFTGQLETIGCASTSSCEAVGASRFETGGEAPLAEHWNGKEWLLQTVSNPSEGMLHGVACSSSLCEAVGANAGSIFAEQWTGSEWKEQTLPSQEGAKGSYIARVSCPSSKLCEAVGEYVNSASKDLTLAESWNGTEWKTQATPNPASSESASLTAISCATGTECEAAGSGIVAGAESLFAEGWNGTEWKLQKPAVPTSAKRTALEGISCPTSAKCEAIGAYENSATEEKVLAELWNGTEWTIQKAPSPEGLNLHLDGLSCSSSVSCYAGGDYTKLTNNQLVSIVEKWNGTEWTIQTVPNAPEPSSSSLQDDSCTSNEICDAVGGYVNGAKAGLLLGEQFSPSFTDWGGLSTYASNRYGGANTDNSFQGVSCVVEAFCFGVGDYFTSADTETAMADVRSFSTGNFTTKLTPVPGGAQASNLQDVSCHGEESYCEGVGGYKSSAGLVKPYAVGLAWQLQLPPIQEGAKASSLLGVSCATSLLCEAVGEYTSSTGVETPAADQWHSTKWALQKALVPSSAKATDLVRVACATSTDCEAVGHYTNASSAEVVLAELWNGSEWAMQSAPNPSSAKASLLRDVMCVSTSFCVAVGDYVNSSGVEVTLAESWNGAVWELSSTPNPEGAKSSTLRGASCISSSDCEAVGDFVNSSGVEEPLTEKGS
jgi:hypothetical protein